MGSLSLVVLVEEWDLYLLLCWQRSGVSISCCVGRGVGSLSLVVLVEEWDLYLR